ncbi:hypothetical protein F5883DRAFT_575808 [Diaporthe sp. PMI_573]|nr:hypothetical protein F5883DRAFT_595465 [Diaporthaceae sp. PMI_573]KAH8752768.1 hypothetical protein F5883DRAFT_575808 [Diaporthaceae sp. PMI_573]
MKVWRCEKMVQAKRTKRNSGLIFTAMAPLRLNATVSDGRITVRFSHKASATIYDKYLQRLEDAFYEKRNCKLAESGDEISMDLPAGITAEPVDRLKDVDLSFTDAEEALAWEEKMILWKYRLPEANKRRLSRALTVEHFADEIAASGQRIDVGLLMSTNLVTTNLGNITIAGTQSFVSGPGFIGNFLFGAKK